MKTANSRDGRPGISVVIASYNSASWLPTTLDSLIEALAGSSWDAEIVLVDDGSTDATPTVLETFAATSPVPLRVVSQPNKGRFLARWEGVMAATHETVLLLDSRVLMHCESMKYLLTSLAKTPDVVVWNGHVETDSSAPLVGHFWSVPTHIFWGYYLANPRPVDITLENFDRVPKGTGMLVVPKAVFQSACRAAWPAGDARFVSDDTKLLRLMAGETPIRLDPGFSATYRPRTSVAEFLGHARVRGTLFVDSYAGTSLARNVALIALAIAPPTLLLTLFALGLLGQGTAFAIVTAAAVLALVLPALLAALRRCPPRAIASYITFILPFGVVFWSGLVRGLRVHRKNFARLTPRHEGQKL